ncbi:MAG: arylesterase [Pseudomonadales bacterium]|nr:arylesterase [Pseudomonadales bacterium]
MAVSLTSTAKESTILVFGDSISAAYGMHKNQGWVHLLGTRLNEKNIAYHVINASVSGETTGGGLLRLPKSLEIHQPDILILELGGNDGLRGYPISRIEANLVAMIQMAQSQSIDILLVGMALPPNYGQRYTSAFTSMYGHIAKDLNLPLVPFLLEGILEGILAGTAGAGETAREKLLQNDRIHPTVKAQPLLLNNVWPYLEKIVLKK